MVQIAIRKSGGANIVSLPKAIVDHFSLHTGSIMDVSIEKNKIVLTPTETEQTLEAILLGSPKELLVLTIKLLDFASREICYIETAPENLIEIVSQKAKLIIA